MCSASKKLIESFFTPTGVQINGNRSFDLQCHDERFYNRLLQQREFALGESYIEGWWDCKQIDEMICRFLSVNLGNQFRISTELIGAFIGSLLVNLQSKTKAQHNASQHYDIGNDLYERMLDQHMIYSCGYWQSATTLDEAQLAKMDLICRKLHLEEGMTLLDIGCGWGAFAEYAAKHYKVIVTGISPAKEQVKVAQKRTQGLPVTILQKDYREISGSFNRIVSVGMLEHVGAKNYDTFFAQCSKLLEPNGLMLHHLIDSNQSIHYTDPWIDKYIFPGSVLPSLTQISRAVEKRFIIEDVHNFGPDYDKTLMAWHANFIKSYPEIQDRYDSSFFRMWSYYLLSCAGAFRARKLQLWQIVMRPIEISSCYIPAR